MRRLAAGAVLAVTAALADPSAQETVERVLARVDRDFIVTQLDVRQARLLRLVVAASDTDAGYLDALVNRRLILQEVARYAPAEPPPAAIAARRKDWEATLGGGVDAARLARAGMTENALTGWLRDDLRIAAFLERRFPLPAVARDDLLRYYREHERDYTVAGVLRPFDDVEADVRARVGADLRAASKEAWIQELRRRAEIR